MLNAAPILEPRLEASTNSDTSFMQCISWLRNCDSDSAHIKCQAVRSDKHASDAWNPTRLLYVRRGPPDAAEDHVYLLDQVTQSESLAYVALSHRWGGDVPLRLKGPILNEFKDGIPVTSLPQTFHDAVTATRKLGLEYLWIDSLCIMQDDIEDWVKESSLMSKVYSRCYVNIAATHSMNSHGGLFSNRDPASITPLKLELHMQGCCTGIYFGLPESQVCSTEYCEDTSPLARRAWVFQERLLAPRTLHFCPQQILFECGSFRATEGSPNHIFWIERLYDPHVTMKQRYVSHRTPKDGKWRLESFWREVVEMYTQRDITKDKDILVALAGLASGLSVVAGEEDEYVAGMWKSEMPVSLMWWPLGATMPGPYLAPSWSWASIKCEWIRMPKKSYVSTQDMSVPVMEVLDVTVEPGNMPLGPVLSASIRVKGSLRKGILLENGRPGTENLYCTFDLGGRLPCEWTNRTVLQEQEFDSTKVVMESGQVAGGAVYFLLAASEWYAHVPMRSGIMLVLTGNVQGQYRRVGVWSETNNDIAYFTDVVLDSDAYEEFDGSHATISIV